MRFHMIKTAVTAWLCVVGVISTAHATLPVVAIHDSELTRALETMPATGSTPTGPGQPAFSGGQPIGTTL